MSEMTGKQIARRLAEVYKSRIIRAIKQCLPLLEKKGVISCVNIEGNSNESGDVDCNQLLKKHKTWRLTTHS